MAIASGRLGRMSLAFALGLFAATVAGAQANPEAERLERLEESESAFTRGVAAHRRGDLDAAALAYRAAIDDDALFVEAMINLARVEIEGGQLESAATWIDRAETQRRDYPGVHATRGLWALRFGDSALAVDALARARELAPQDVEVLVNLGAALIERGFAREAIEVSRQAERLDAGRAETQLNLGLAHDRMQKASAAQYHYRRYLERSSPDDPSRAEIEERLAELGDVRPSEPASPIPFRFEDRSQRVRPGRRRTMKYLNGPTRGRAGFTLIEILVAVAILAILSAALTPMVIKYVNDGRRARALSDTEDAGPRPSRPSTSIPGRGPSTTTRTSMTAASSRVWWDSPEGFGNADIPDGAGAAPGDRNWNGGGAGGVAGAMEDHLIFNRTGAVDPLYPVSATPPQPPGWNGPYLDAIPVDPWNRPYVCNVRYLQDANVNGTNQAERDRHAVLCLSSGQNGQFETSFAGRDRARRSGRRRHRRPDPGQPRSLARFGVPARAHVGRGPPRGRRRRCPHVVCSGPFFAGAPRVRPHPAPLRHVPLRREDPALSRPQGTSLAIRPGPDGAAPSPITSS